VQKRPEIFRSLLLVATPYLGPVGGQRSGIDSLIQGEELGVHHSFSTRIEFGFHHPRKKLKSTNEGPRPT